MTSLTWRPHLPWRPANATWGGQRLGWLVAHPCYLATRSAARSYRVVLHCAPGRRR